MTPRDLGLSRGFPALLLLVLGACASGPHATLVDQAETAPRAPAAAHLARYEAPKPRAAPSTLSLRFPDNLTLVRAQLRDSEGKLTVTCASRPACRALRGWAGPSGLHSIEVEYLAPDGVRESFSTRFFGGYDELLVVLEFSNDKDGLLDGHFSYVESFPLEGVSLRQTSPSAYGELPSIELVNGSSRPIYAVAIADKILLNVDEPDYGLGGFRHGCGFGRRIFKVDPGTSVPAIAYAPQQPRVQGFYQVTVRYGVSEEQLLSNVTGREASLDLEIDGPAPAPTVTTTVPSAEPEVPREQGVSSPPAPDFAPFKTDGARDPGLARWLELEQEVAGTLTPTVPRRYFRVRRPPNHDGAATEFYARCQSPPCAGMAYAVLNDPRDAFSVSDARDLRASGGWTSLDDEQDLLTEESVLLVVGCVDGCPGPVQFVGRVHARKNDEH